MFFFNLTLIPFLLIGLAWIIFSGPIVAYALKRETRSLFGFPKYEKIALLWFIRFLGTAGILVFLYMSIDRPDREMMKDDANRLALLENGKTVEGKILKCWYDNWAPSAWMVLYSFELPNQADHKPKIYYGSARGPKTYFSNLQKGVAVTIIYDPNRPRINSEMYEFLNFPGNRRSFRLAGKLEMLNKFWDQYSHLFESYSYLTWYDEAMQK